MIREALTEITTEIAQALDGDDVTVTADPTEAASAIAYGGTVLLVLASPRITWETYTRATATWTVWAITGATTDPVTALDTFDPILNALPAALGLDSAQPQTYDVGDRTRPGYELTFTTEHL